MEEAPQPPPEKRARPARPPKGRAREISHHRHRERNEAIHQATTRKNGLLRFARNDEKANRMPRFILPFLLALAGLILFGQGAYIHAKALLAQVLLERAFNTTIATGHQTKPWSWADTWPVARIEVKRIHARAIVLSGSSGQALAFGPGHVELTPNAGERGVAVYSAHRDTHFAFLKNVTVGDEIDITRSDGRMFRYRADATSVVRFDTSGIDPLAGGHELVLSTCWPFGALTPGPDRYLLHATMIEPGS
jgi:sortase A